jgi:hypothetical protein
MEKRDARENRQKHRQRVARPGRFSLGGAGAMPCSIRDVSDSGARLEVAEGAGWITTAVDIQDVMTGVVRKGIVAWRFGTSMGIRFIDRGAWPCATRAPGPTPFGRRLP